MNLYQYDNGTAHQTPTDVTVQIHIIVATLTAHVGILVAAVPTIIVEVAHPALPQTAPVLAHKLVLRAGVVLGHAHLAVVANDEVTSFVAGALHLVVGGRVTTLTAAAIVVGAQVVGACQRDREGDGGGLNTVGTNIMEPASKWLESNFIVVVAQVAGAWSVRQRRWGGGVNITGITI